MQFHINSFRSTLKIYSIQSDVFFSIPIYCDECTPQDQNLSGHKGRKAHISISDKHNSLLLSQH